MVKNASTRVIKYHIIQKAIKYYIFQLKARIFYAACMTGC